jgi:hypothetical protein
MKKIKKIFQKFRNFLINFSKNKIFHGNLPEARGFRELDHKQYELERYGMANTLFLHRI